MSDKDMGAKAPNPYCDYCDALDFNAPDDYFGNSSSIQALKELPKKERKNMRSEQTVQLNIVPQAAPTMHSGNYIRERVYEIFYRKEAELEKKFFITRPQPKDFEEAKKWFDEGNFIFGPYVDCDGEASDRVFGASTHLKWGKEPEDKKGLEEAMKALRAAQQKVSDVLAIISDEAARLAALREFEAFQA